MTSLPGKHWDIFCKIVDNYGDIGVCWRLSQQLADEFSINVRLFIDDIHVAQKIIPHLEISKTQQTINQVQIISWQNLNSINIGAVDVVIEAFGCELPTQYLEKMSSETLWINLEYLSAEKWVSDFHAKPSKHPSLPFTKYYFFPGFVENTGGLIREKKLIEQRDDFLVSQAIQNNFWQCLVGKSLDDPTIKLSLFCYPQAQIKDLITDLLNTDQKISIFIASNSIFKEINSIFLDFKPNIGEVYEENNLTFHVLPFISQSDYDRLLWACDLNFVRGEDSWIRAIWAGKPFIWQPYVQTEDTHITKLNAFLDFYTQHATKDVGTLIKQASLSWSGYVEANTPKNIWSPIIDQLPSIAKHSKNQSALLANQPDLATKLVIFSEKVQKNQV